MKAIDKYFKTENEHWNDAIFTLYNKVVKSGLFPDAEVPLKLFSDGINGMVNDNETPAKAVSEFIDTLKSIDLPGQLLILNEAGHYFKNSVFDEGELSEITTLIDSYISKLNPEKPQVANLREALKSIVKNELDALPETIKELEPLQRLNIVTKLLPYVMPKIESIHFEDVEGNDWML